MLHIASLIGSFSVLYFKEHYKRARPSHVCPALLPPLPVPGHASFPSGHATQAYLMALCMNRILSGTISETDRDAIHDNLQTLACRIARNREIAGLHYPHDSLGGRVLAISVHETLGTVDLFNDAIAAAKAEWSS